MDIQTNVSLKEHTTMRLGGAARFFVDVSTSDQLQLLHTNALGKGIPTFVLGGGSNIIAVDEGFNGLILHMCIPGFVVVEDTDTTTTISVGAGEQWDAVVERTVAMGLSGIEALSAIPGTTGATPVQNVGAYGQEVADTIIGIEALDTQSNTYIRLSHEECEFGYRQSIFNTRALGRYIIIGVTFRLSKLPPSPPFYNSLQSYLTAHNVTSYTPQVIRNAVITIRSEKLPDPKLLANTGSFFKNVIVKREIASQIQEQYYDLHAYEMEDGLYKIPSGWLIEKAGLKGTLHSGMRVYDKNALVLINESASGYADLVAARNTIIGIVQNMFNVTLQQEPLELH